ncbi:flagellar hook-length control protein FliK [Paenibacillus sp. GCM10012306]|uniref:flagellar hook-length control protein FliK n=1 Tax=Paenibacillus sp. GCM10012306 TaxID=3317342 RepID=UPI003609642B
MSLIIQSLMGSNALTGSSQSGASAGSTTTQPFAQTLVQTMGAKDASATPQSLGSLTSLLMGLLGATQQTVSESGDQQGQQTPEDLLNAVTEELEKQDDKISSDPVLQAALQGWLILVSAAGNSFQELTEDGHLKGGGLEGSLPPLAQHSATLRFALQDELHNLVNVIQQSADKGDEVAVAKGVELVKQLSAMLELVAPSVDQTKTANGPLVDTSTAAVEQLLGVESKTKSQDKAVPVLRYSPVDATAAKGATSSSQTAIQQGTTEEQPDTPTVSGAKAVTAVAAKGVAKEEESAQVKPTEAGEHEIVTAGQLSLRNGITAMHKAEAPSPQVPVHQFAEEMTGFITGKLEIVRKGSAAEATISLFPEHLGQVDVKITMQNGHLVAQFMTEHAATKDMLEQQMTQLRAALQSQGLQVEKLEVTQNNAPLHSQFGQEGRQPGSGGQQSGNNRSKQRSEDTGDAVLAAELTGDWRDWVAGEGSGERNHGGSFSAKI